MPFSGGRCSVDQSLGRVFRPIGSQLGRGQHRARRVERSRAGGAIGCWHRWLQIGRISHALILLLAHLHPETPLTPDETAAIGNNVLNSVGDVKAKLRRPATRPCDEIPISGLARSR
jgi:hypothetical protein